MKRKIIIFLACVLGAILLIISIGIGYLAWTNSLWSSYQEELSVFESDTSAKYISADRQYEISFNENDIPIFIIHGEQDIVYDMQFFARSDGYFTLRAEIDGNLQFKDEGNTICIKFHGTPEFISQDTKNPQINLYKDSTEGK